MYREVPWLRLLLSLASLSAHQSTAEWGTIFDCLSMFASCFFIISPCIVCGSLFDFRVGVLDMGLDCDVKETERSHRVQIRLEHEVKFAMCTEPSRLPRVYERSSIAFFFSSGP